MADGAYEEGYEHSNGVGEVGFGREVDVTAEEIVDWNVPFSGEFEPGLIVRWFGRG
jgi:hypothetical protein